MKFCKKSIVICILVCIVLVAYIVRFNAVNTQFPESKLSVIKTGETVEKDGLKYTMVSGDIMSGKDYIEKYGDEDSFEAGDNVLVVYFDVENTTNKKQKIGTSDMVAKCGLWANGVEYGSLWYVNDEDFDDTVEKNRKVRVGLTANINSDLEQMVKNEWRIEINGWPNRIELTVPMNGGET